jgi:hypothetical protein
MRNRKMHIHAGWLIDGSGAAVQKNMRIDLQNEMIQKEIQQI